MPLYEYHCNTCGQEFEQMVRLSEADLSPACPACDSKETKKKLSVFAAHGISLSGGSLSTSDNCGSSGGFS